MRKRPPDRRPTISRDIEAYDAMGNKFKLTITIGFNEGKACEVFFNDRGKTGTAFNQVMLETGIWISQVLQGEDPYG
jgi:hypothetical protein